MIARSGIPAGSKIWALAEETARIGGRLLIVGGWVRDQLRGQPSKDLDAEIFGLSPEAIDDLLARYESIGRVGRHFPVWRLRHQDLDIGFPREGALEYDPRTPASIDDAFRRAARHRDLTLNAIAWDPLEDRCIDPWGGQRDLEAGCLRAVDSKTFVTDPIRGLRVGRLRAHLEAEATAETTLLCGTLCLGDVPVERQTGELRRILLEPARPSRAFEFLAQTKLIEAFPLLAALRGVEQDVRWHPEGDVFVHTLRVVDVAREIGASLDAPTRETLQWAALCHDLGKATTTTHVGDRIRSLGHEAVGAELTRIWLEALRIPQRIARMVATLVQHHLAPAQFVAQGAGPRAYRRLARKLGSGGVTAIELERVARADHLGRTTEDAIARRFDAGAAFLAHAESEGVVDGVRSDVVPARALIEAGFLPGPLLGRALARARELQDEGGETDSRSIIEVMRREFADELQNQDGTRETEG